MTPSFFGRATELAELAAAWTGPRSAFIPIYGRRRTGKSRLIVEFAVGKPAIYHVGKQGPAPLQRREFLQFLFVNMAFLDTFLEDFFELRDWHLPDFLDFFEFNNGLIFFKEYEVVFIEHLVIFGF